MNRIFRKALTVVVLTLGLAVALECSAQTDTNRQSAADDRKGVTQSGFANPQTAPRTEAGPADVSGPSAPPLSKPADMTESEKYLLAEIERLNNRLAELEARLADRLSVNASAEPRNAPAPSPEARAAKADPSPSAKPEETEALDARVARVQTGANPEKKKAAEPFAFADFTWLTGNPRTKEPAMDTKFFTPEFRADVDYIYDFNHPQDDTIGGSSEVFRSSEFQITQLGVGGDFHYDNVRGRLMTQFGLYSQTTPRNDASPARGQWNLANAYRYLSEAYGGYHFNVLHGINVDAGIFLSYIGLFSYYQFDNWA